MREKRYLKKRGGGAIDQEDEEGAAYEDFGESEPREPASRKPLVAMLVTLLLLVATGLYDVSSSPPAPVVIQASISPLTGSSSASVTLVVNVSSATPAIGAHYLFDPTSKLVVPLDGRPPFAVEMGQASEVVADRDTFVWIERKAPTVISYYDVERGLLRNVTVVDAREPLAGTLVAGGGLVAWSYNTSGGTVAMAGFQRGADVVIPFPGARSENRTAVAALKGDVFYSTTPDRGDLWNFNLTTERSTLLAVGTGGGKVSVGNFFAVWVNQSAASAEYFDLYDRVVRPLPAPDGVVPRWALADDLTVLIGGLRQGLIFSSPRVEFYDFGTGNSHIYDSVGVDFDQTPYFGYGDRVVVTVESLRLPRSSAPLTPYLIGLVILSTAATAIVAAREMGRPEP